jgi:DNA-binding FrmR family transcriptional regulator
MNEHNHGHIHEHGEGQTHAHLNIAQEPAVSHAHAHNSQEAGDPHAHTHHQQEGHSHHHVHSEEEKRAVINRLSRAIGHLESVRRMVERDEDCSDVLIQLAAVRNAINNTGKVIMKNHISHCIVDAIEEDDMEAVEALNRAIDRFIK